MNRYNEEKRQSPRMPVELDVEVHCPGMPVRVLRTVDLSDSGLLMVMDSAELPPLGSHVQIQVVGKLGNNDSPPVVKAQVVRHIAGGFAVSFEDI